MSALLCQKVANATILRCFATIHNLSGDQNARWCILHIDISGNRDSTFIVLANAKITARVYLKSNADLPGTRLIGGDGYHISLRPVVYEHSKRSPGLTKEVPLSRE